MQAPQIKQLQILVESTISGPFESIQSNSVQIAQLLSFRVDMPKHFITQISKKFATKDFTRIQKIFDMLAIVTHMYSNGITLFNQISGNKEFLFKISSVLTMKDLSQNIKIKIVDLVYDWKQEFKPNKELFPNFWTFYTNFEKKGYTPSNLNFQTKNQIPNQPLIKEQTKAQTVSNNNNSLFDLVQQKPNFQAQNFSIIQPSALFLFSKVIQKIILQNTIINNTSPQILDFPPVLKENMFELKNSQDNINKFIGQHKNQPTIQTATNLIKAIHLTQKRYTQLLSRYLPQKFELNSHLCKFSEYCKSHQQDIKENKQNLITKQLDLLDLGETKNNANKGGDLLDLGNQTNNNTGSEQKGIKNFFGNLLNNLNAPKPQVTLSNQPIQNDFKTDMDFMQYRDPKSIKQIYDDVKNWKAQDLLGSSK